jgi:hypothetical protein
LDRLISGEANTPVAYSQTPLILDAGKPPNVTHWWLSAQACERVYDAPTDLWVESPEITLRCSG